MPEAGADRGSVVVLGLADDRLDLLSPEARQALAGAQLVVGGRRHLELWSEWTWPLRRPAGHPRGGRRRRRRGGRGAPADGGAGPAGGRPGLGRPGFSASVGLSCGPWTATCSAVLPAPSAVSLAFARLGLPWDDAVVVAVRGRRLADAAGIMRVGPKVAVLTSPESPPEAVGQVLWQAGVSMDLVAVCSRFGSLAESVRELTLKSWPPARSTRLGGGPGRAGRATPGRLGTGRRRPPVRGRRPGLGSARHLPVPARDRDRPVRSPVGGHGPTGPAGHRGAVGRRERAGAGWASSAP